MKVTQDQIIKENSIETDQKPSRQARITKGRIYKEVFELMLTQNFDKITVSILEKRLNLTRGAIFYHFSNKDEIIVLTIKHYANQINDILFPTPPTIQPSLESYIIAQNKRLEDLFVWIKKESNTINPAYAIMNFYIQCRTYFPALHCKIHEALTMEEYGLTLIITNAIQKKEIKDIIPPHKMAKIFINLYLSIYFRESDDNHTSCPRNPQIMDMYDMIKLKK